jgi:hypothetical protein
MKVDALTLELRPRSMNEAADLGVRMVQANARSLWQCFLPVYAVVVALALSLMDVAQWLPSLVIFWLKPWLDRTLLFVLSRAAFGQATGVADLWRARGAVWWSRLAVTLSVRRLSPWRSYTQPIDQLEGQQGSALRARCATVLSGQRGRAAGMQFVFSNLELVLNIGALALVVWFSLPGHQSAAVPWLTGGSNAALWMATLVYAAVVLLVEPFYVGAGFSMYLNRRVQLEAWDVEQEFRRAFG